MKRKALGAVLIIVLAAEGFAETIRVFIAGSCEITLEEEGGAGAVITLPYYGSALIFLPEDIRFLRGIELELTAPQEYLPYRGSLALGLYGGLGGVPDPGSADVEGTRLFFEALPARIKTVYQIPLKSGHGLKTTPYVRVPVGEVPAASFPLLFRLTPVVKGLSDEIETMNFSLAAKPVLSGEGAVRLSFSYPEQLPGGEFTVLIDDAAEGLEAGLTDEGLLLKEGEHSLVILSEDYRNESKRFQIERAKVLDLTVELQDPTPLLVFEAPENARVYLDGALVTGLEAPQTTVPGPHEVRFQVGDYSVVKTLQVEKGKTYRVALEVDVTVDEE